MNISSVSSIESSDRLVEEVDLRRIKSTLVIMYCGRSGSYLLSNLMDGHSEILSCPPHSMAKVIENITDILLSAKKKSQFVTPDDLIEGIVKHQPFLFKETDHTVLEKEPNSGGTQNSEMGVNKSKFCSIAKKLLISHFKKYNEEARTSDIFSLIHWAYALALGHKISTNTPTICWQRHGIVLPQFLNFIAGSITNPIFIHTIRRFEDALDSHMEEMAPEFESREEMGQVLINQFAYNLARKDIDIPQLAIKFEDMHINTEVLMRKFCQRLEIGFETILLETTLDKHVYFFDKNGETKTGVNKHLKRKMKFDNLSVHDLIFLNLLLCKHYNYYGYEFHPATVAFVECDSHFLSNEELIHFLKGIIISGKSYLANLITVGSPDSKVNPFFPHKKSFKPFIQFSKPLELIIARADAN